MHTTTAGPTAASSVNTNMPVLTALSLSAPDSVTSAHASTFQYTALAQQHTLTAIPSTKKLVGVAAGSNHASSSLSTQSSGAGEASQNGFDPEQTSRFIAGPHSSAVAIRTASPSAAVGSPYETQITTSPIYTPDTTPLATTGSQMHITAFL